jgi:hypothetical protein
MEMTAKKTRYTRDALWAELRQRGLRMSFGKFSQLCSYEKGPPIAGFRGVQHLYELGPALIWAEPYINPAETVEIVA